MVVASKEDGRMASRTGWQVVAARGGPRGRVHVLVLLDDVLDGLQLVHELVNPPRVHLRLLVHVVHLLLQLAYDRVDLAPEGVRCLDEVLMGLLSMTMYLYVLSVALCAKQTLRLAGTRSATCTRAGCMSAELAAHFLRHIVATLLST